MNKIQDGDNGSKKNLTSKCNKVFQQINNKKSEVVSFRGRRGKAYNAFVHRIGVLHHQVRAVVKNKSKNQL